VDWQPLETAPRDGTEVELRCEHGMVLRVKWGSWTYARGEVDTYWCSPAAGWTMSRDYKPDAWRPVSN
jgi:hypothetical protein